MKYVDVTFADAATNLACDEALLQACEHGEEDTVLRVWEPENYAVVLGYSNRANTEVDPTACARLGIPILRRFSGGGTVLQGPGCINYALVLTNEQIGNIPQSYGFVLTRHQSFVSAFLGLEVNISGGSDLTILGRKFSGNSQHRQRRFTLIHGTFLLNMDLSLMNQVLPIPSKQPAYRENRSHADFLMNLPVESESLKRGLQSAWNAKDELDRLPAEKISRLLRERYSRREWNLKF